MNKSGQNTRPVVAVTALEYRKGGDVFAGASDFDMRSAPADEAELAAWIRANGAFAAVVGTAPYRDELYRVLPRGGVVARFGVGCDGIDRAAAARCGVDCVNTPGVLDDAVAEFAVGLLLSVARKIAATGGAVRPSRLSVGPSGATTSLSRCLIRSVDSGLV